MWNAFGIFPRPINVRLSSWRRQLDTDLMTVVWIIKNLWPIVISSTSRMRDHRFMECSVRRFVSCSVSAVRFAVRCSLWSSLCARFYFSMCGWVWKNVLNCWRNVFAICLPMVNSPIEAFYWVLMGRLACSSRFEAWRYSIGDYQAVWWPFNEFRQLTEWSPKEFS